MAKFLSELLGCTLADKGTPVLFECRNQPLGLRTSSKQRPTILVTLTNESAAPYTSRPNSSLFSTADGGKSCFVVSVVFGSSRVV
ncbi:Ras-GEF domain-containing family member 1B-A [Takifugu flavidus]|uniref:Ras-GEF domain-containing family member 1B-A n=1 Tax=Takifugu flavidus TaxID=433684 RepID=A0A5C6N1I9_9TELE|nr:Ras-GEF domain-containing family member 1B-A [Takifugu flavidus]